MYIVEALSPRRQSVMSEDAVSVADSSYSVSKHQKEQVEGNLKLYEPKLECGREVMCVRFSPDGKALAVGQADGIIKIFDPDKEKHLYSLSTPDDRLPVTSINFKPAKDSKAEHQHILIATYASGAVRNWHYTSGECLATIAEGRQTLSSTIDPSASRMVTSGGDPKINVYDLETQKLLQTLEPSDSRDVMDGHKLRVFTVKYHPLADHTFVSGGWDNTVQFWDDRVPHSIRKFYGPHICGDALDIDGAHSHIITGSWRKDNVLQIWDFGSGELIKDVPQDPMQGSLLYCCQWLGKDSIVCGGADKNMARVIDRGTLNTVGQLVHLPKAVYCLDNDRTAKPKIAVGAASSCYVIKVAERKS